MLPTCTFVSTPIHLREPGPPDAPPLGSVSKPIPGEFLASDPLSAPISGALVIPSGLHFPSGPFETFRIRAFNRCYHRKPAKPCARQPKAPRSVLFRCSLRFIARSPLLARLGYRSVNPGTEPIIV
jgi:hypothetical protein